MPPDASWPNIRNPLAISAEDHASHRSPKGIPMPEDLIAGLKSHKQAKLLLKMAKKPRLKPQRSVRTKRKKK